MHSSHQNFWACLCLSAIVHGSLLLPPPGARSIAGTQGQSPTSQIIATLKGGALTVAGKHITPLENKTRPKASPAGEAVGKATDWPSWPFATPAEEPMYLAPDEVEERASAPALPEDTPLPDSESGNGRLLVKLFISREGILDRVEILESTLPESYSNQLIELIMKQSFTPAKSQGAMVASWKLMELIFESGPPPNAPGDNSPQRADLHPAQRPE